MFQDRLYVTANSSTDGARHYNCLYTLIIFTSVCLSSVPGPRLDLYGDRGGGRTARLHIPCARSRSSFRWDWRRYLICRGWAISALDIAMINDQGHSNVLFLTVFLKWCTRRAWILCVRRNTAANATSCGISGESAESLTMRVASAVFRIFDQCLLSNATLTASRRLF